MGELEQDEAYRRLRAADPAAHVDPDLDRVLAAARARAGLEPAAPADPGAVDRGVVDRAVGDRGVVDRRVVDLAARRRRRTRVWQVAAGVVTVVAVGASGYGLGARGSSSAATQIGAPEAASMAGSTLKDAAGTIEPGSIGPGTVDRGAVDAAGRAAGPRTFVADGVGQDAGSGAAYSLGGSTASAAWADRFAQAWHVDGKAVE
ncbi:MAG: hypothetical protein KJ792_15135 [Actinobacteria bacterium]|nr:hypothetical protein [Actinomycetota bacterium]